MGADGKSFRVHRAGAVEHARGSEGYCGERYLGVGSSRDANFNFHPLALHYDGASWSIIPTPGLSRLVAIDCVASNDIWRPALEPGHAAAICLPEK